MIHNYLAAMRRRSKSKIYRIQENFHGVRDFALYCKYFPVNFC